MHLVIASKQADLSTQARNRTRFSFYLNLPESYSPNCYRKIYEWKPLTFEASGCRREIAFKRLNCLRLLQPVGNVSAIVSGI